MAFMCRLTAALPSLRCRILYTGTLAPVKSHCRDYVTKKKSTMDLIKWNTDNLRLYGAKLKPAVKTKTAKTKSKTSTQENEESVGQMAVLDSGKKSKKKNSKSKKEAAPATEMDSEALPGFSGLDGIVMEDAGVEERIMGLKPRFNDDSGSDSAGEFVNNSYNIDIPKMLPVPGSGNMTATGQISSFNARHENDKAVTSGKRKSVSTEKESQSVLTPAQKSTLDFVLRFPLFPDCSQENASSQLQDFKTLVAACKLRFPPTVNVVLNKTRSDLSSFFLQRWREKMIKELGEVGFKKHQEETIWQGTNLHACVQQYLSGVPLSEIQIQERNQGHWTSIASVLEDVSDIQALETSVSHPFLHYKGTFDCVAKYKNALCVIDWKTSSKPKPLLSNTYDNPVQVAAYLGALNACEQFTSRFGVVEHAAIVVAYANGEIAHVHRMPPAICGHYWTEWCQRLHQYWALVVAEKLGKEMGDEGEVLSDLQ